MAANTIETALAPGSSMPLHLLSGTFSDRPALGDVFFVASTPASAAADAPAKPLPSKSASAAGSSASNMVRLPLLAPPAAIIASKPAIKAFGPASAQDLEPDLLSSAAMPMNMMLIRTPLDPPMELAQRPPRHAQMPAGSANGILSKASMILAPALANVEPQSASPTLLSRVSKTPFASMRALHAFSNKALISASLEGLKSSNMSFNLMPATGAGKNGATAFGQAAQEVSALRRSANWGVRRRRDSDIPFMSRDVHSGAGPSSNLIDPAHLDFMRADTMMHISSCGTAPKLLTRHA
mmetsp:Transcript_138417/g.442349  ORF Transcript_138417/g.442349 Transcript_138417/m.442349 type:complete len:296 (+) Transcript_138417:265-1152(+)